MEYQGRTTTLNNSNDDEIDLTSLYRLFIRNKRLIGFFSFIGTFIVIIFTLVEKPVYLDKLVEKPVYIEVIQ